VVLAQVLSPPVMEILSRGLKRSQNLYLQNLLQIAGIKAQASAEQAGDPPPGFLSSEAWGTRALKQLLERIGIASGATQIEEGAGLSRQDLSTPEAMVHLLSYLANQPYGAQLRDALPSAGVDGTLEGRMRNTAAADNVHAKTGSMNNVRCLVGYMTTAAGERLAFAIMLNNFVRGEDELSPSRTLDAIVALLAQFQGHT
jgi:D-alanyl-D-alanine carboxypeptidase/D-alanyl-D-alanine-endopeptidase (penicillin-binding protein 4)